MTGVSLAPYADDLIRRYQQGQTMGEIAAAYGASRSGVRKVLAERGTVTGHARGEAHRQEAVSRYLAGESVIGIARSLGLSSKRVARFIRESGSEIRGPGQPVPSSRNISAAERRMAEMLAGAGLVPLQQVRVGKKLVDIAIGNVAVELFSPRHRYLPEGERLCYLLDRGWDVIYVWADDGTHFPLTSGAAEYVVSWLERASSDPSPVSRYGVIRGDGQLVHAGRADDDYFPVVIPIVRPTKFRPGEIPAGTCRCGCGDSVRGRFRQGHNTARRPYYG